jgi:transcriptional regulator with XRE-family HTH domain
MIAQSKQASKQLRELRELADVTISRAAKVAGVSFGTLWNFEHDKAVLRDRQISTLIALYLRKFDSRTKRISRLLASNI